MNLKSKLLMIGSAMFISMASTFGAGLPISWQYDSSLTEPAEQGGDWEINGAYGFRSLPNQESQLRDNLKEEAASEFKRMVQKFKDGKRDFENQTKQNCRALNFIERKKVTVRKEFVDLVTGGLAAIHRTFKSIAAEIGGKATKKRMEKSRTRSDEAFDLKDPNRGKKPINDPFRTYWFPS